MPKKDVVEYTISKRVPGKVVLVDALFRCTKCGGWKLASEVGLRVMNDGTLRNQPQCKACRSA